MMFVFKAMTYNLHCVTFVLCLFVPCVSGRTCMPRDRVDRYGIAEYGDIMLGGLFPIHGDMATPEHSYKEPPEPVHCLQFDQRGFQFTMAMIFAVNEINNNDFLFPNITLGYVIHDNCFRMPKSIENSLNYIEPISADEDPCYYQVVVTASGSSHAVGIARLLGLFHIPQISGAAACKCLSDKQIFHNFMRTVPSDLHHANAIAHLVLHFEWVFVGALAVDDDFGRTGLIQILNEVERKGVCIAFHELLPTVKSPETFQQLGKLAGKTSAHVIILYSNEADALPFIEELLLQNVTAKTWIATSDWVKSRRYASSRYAHILEGTIGFVQTPGKMPGFYEFLIKLKPENQWSIHNTSYINRNQAENTSFTEDNIEIVQEPKAEEKSLSLNEKSLNDYVVELWEDIFSCTLEGIKIGLQPCSGKESLDKVYSQFTDVSSLLDVHNTYQAVYVVAYALMDIQSCTYQNSRLQNGSCAGLSDFQPWQLLLYLRNVKWSTNTGVKMFFDENGDPPGPHELIIWERHENGKIIFKKIGHYDSDASPDKKLFFNPDAFKWNGGTTKVPQSVCSETCKPGTRKVARKGEPFCCFDCIQCTTREYSNDTDSTECFRCPIYFWSTEERNGCQLMAEDYLAFNSPAAFMILSFTSLGIVIIMIVGMILFHHRHLPVMKYTDGRVIVIFLLALTASLLSSLISIGAPDDEKCLIRDTLICVCLTFAISCVLNMAWKLNTSSDGSLYKFKIIIEQFMVMLHLMPQIIYCLLWAFVGKPRLIRNTESNPNMVILECGGTSTAWPVGSLSYLMFLAISCYTLSFKALKLRIPHNEAKFITYSMTVCLLVCLAFVPAYNSTQGTFNLITKIFAVIVTSFGLLGCITLPKCYAVLVKSDK